MAFKRSGVRLPLAPPLWTLTDRLILSCGPRLLGKHRGKRRAGVGVEAGEDLSLVGPADVREGRALRRGAEAAEHQQSPSLRSKSATVAPLAQPAKNSTLSVSSAPTRVFAPRVTNVSALLLSGRMCKSPEEYKAWSQNLGHEHVLTTFSSYGDVAGHRQAEIIRALGRTEQRAGMQRPECIESPA